MQSAERLFHYTGRDLTGYEDSTVNPKDDAAVKAAISKQPGRRLKLRCGPISAARIASSGDVMHSSFFALIPGFF